MITPSFNLTATERVLPKLALDFTTAVLDSRVTFTRTTGASNPATYTNSSGVITAATNNQPRFDYDPIALTCKGLLIEESRANLTTYSDDLGNAAWTKSASTVTTNATTSPDGTVNADKLFDTATTAAHYAFPAVTAVTTGTTYTASYYFKAAENTFAQLTFSTTQFGSGQYANFNLSTGVVTAQSGGTATITNAGNGWYRCTFTAACTTSGNATCIAVMLLSGTAGRLASYAGNASNGLFVWGAQLETGAFATSYIPTTTTALTRNADVATMTGTNFSDWFNATEGTFVAQASVMNFTNSDIIVDATDGTTSNRIQLYVAGVTGAATSFMATGGATQGQFSAGTISVNTTFNFASAYKVNALAASLNATSPATDTSATMPSGINTTTIGCRFNGVNQLNGHFKKLNYYPQRLTNAELQAFSK